MRDIIIRLIKENIKIDGFDEALEKGGYLADIDIDSIIFIQMIVQIESKFDIEIDTEHLIMENYETIYDFIDYIEKLVKEKE